MKRDLSELYDVLESDDIDFQIEESRKFIWTIEKKYGWRREFTELTGYHDWKKYFKNYTAQITPSKLIIPKLKIKRVEKYLKSLYPKVECIRTLLEAELQRHGKKKIYYRSDFKEANKLYFPYKFKVGFFRGDFVKIDIKRCFYTIYSQLGIDVSVISEIDHESRTIQLKSVGQGVITAKTSNLIKSLKDYKELRNAIYGLTRHAFGIYLYPNGKIEKKFIRTNLQNLDLLVAIASLLHSIVYKFWNHIIYWNIDGGIIYSDILEDFKNELESLGFEFEIEAQDTQAEVLGLGSYAIGSKVTAHYEHGIKSKVESKENIYKVINEEKIKNWFRRV